MKQFIRDVLHQKKEAQALGFFFVIALGVSTTEAITVGFYKGLTTLGVFLLIISPILYSLASKTRGQRELWQQYQAYRSESEN